MERTYARNPFRFEGPLDRSELIGRDEELSALEGHALDRRVVSLAAPRRYGKTSLLRATAEVLQADHGFVVAHVDLQALADVDDFIARFGSAWRAATRGHRRARRAFETLAGGLSSFGLTLLGTGVQFNRRERAEQQALTVAHALLDLPGEVEAPVLVVLDEFQDLHGAWPAGEGVLRSHTQSPSQAGRVAYAFAGSEPSLLAAAFEDRGRAYYQQVLRLPIGRLADEALVRGISRRFVQTGKDSGAALSPLLRLVAGHPQRAMLLAHLLWERTPAGGVADASTWARALEAARLLMADEAAGVWESLTVTQRAALLALVNEGSATAAGSATPKSSRQRAVAALKERGVVEVDERVGTRGGVRLRVVDPLLADWVVTRRG